MMKQVTLYDKVTGELGPQIFNTMEVIEAMVGDRVAYQEGAWDRSDYQVNPATKKVYQKYPDLPLLKQRAWDEIKNIKAKIQYGTLVTALGTLQIDTAARLAINTAALTALATGPLFSVQWKMADNSLVRLDARAMLDIQAAVQALDARLTQTAAGLQVMIQDAINGKALEAVKWPNG